MVKSTPVELKPKIFQLPGEKPGSHVYLIRGSNKNVLIDTSITSDFPRLRYLIQEIGLAVNDIHLVLLSHEHFDHIGAATYFFETAVIGAHRLAANKIELQDEFVTMNKYMNVPSKPFFAHIWLGDDTTVNLGNYELKIIHTPGHTSGCICIYETQEKLLFSGDTVFANGTLSDIATSGNISDYVNSIKRLSTLKISELYPGHGCISQTPERDIKQAVYNAQNLLKESKILFEAVTMKTDMPTRQRIDKEVTLARARKQKKE